MVDAMLAAAAPIELPAGPDPVDIVGTGGAPSRRAHALNVSTMASFVAGGAGARVVKHGNRRASSTSGSVDLLEALGVVRRPRRPGGGALRGRVRASASASPAPSTRPCATPARCGPSSACPTVFNFLGPLSNPAGVRRQVIGVSDARVAPTVVGVLADPGRSPGHGRHRPRRHGRADHHRGRRPCTSCATARSRPASSIPTRSASRWSTWRRWPEGIPAANAAIARRVLAGEPGPHRDIVALNAGAALVVAGVVRRAGRGRRAGPGLDRLRSGGGRARSPGQRLERRPASSGGVTRRPRHRLGGRGQDGRRCRRAPPPARWR